MFGKLLPYTTDFVVFFEKHIVVCAQAAQDLFDMLPSSHSDHIKQARKISVLEKEADEITHQCVEALHKTFITPFERNDIHILITKMDDIVDGIEDVAARIVLYKLDTNNKEAADLITVLQAAIEGIKQAIGGLRKTSSLEATEAAFHSIHKLENEGDIIVRQAIGKLFDNEKDLLALIKWKEIYESLEDSIDVCEEVANIIEGVIIESS